MRLAVMFLMLMTGLASGAVMVAPAPEGEPLSTLCRVTVEGKEVPVYPVKVAPADPKLRFKQMDEVAQSGKFFDEAAFAYFDQTGPARVTVTYSQDVTSAKVLPASANIVPRIEGRTISFDLAGPAKLTVEVNGSWVKALHLFASPPETDMPKEGDPGVMYFGPGLHEVDGVKVGSNTTVYVAAGAVVRGKATPGEERRAAFLLEGDNITLRGRGIIDGSLAPIHSRHLVFVKGNHIRLEGVILRDASGWTVPIRQSRDVKVENLKVLGYRANSDGIDICNSTDVTVSDCFLRTLDDLIVVKTDRGQGPARNILVEKCVLWSEVAHALSIGAELREDVDGVTFRDCDVIHDKGREWTLRVFHCDAARIRNVRFENIRVEESERLISLWIDKTGWSLDAERGHIEGVVFKNITSASGASKVEFKGFDAGHQVTDVRLEDVVIRGQALRPGDVIANRSVEGITITPLAPGEPAEIEKRDF